MLLFERKIILAVLVLLFCIYAQLIVMASNFAATAPTKLVPVDEEYFDLHTIMSVNSNVKCTFDKNFPVEIASNISISNHIKSRHRPQSSLNSLRTTISSLTEFFPLVGQKQPHAIPDKGLQIEIPAWMVNAVSAYNQSCQMVVPAAYSSVRRDSIKASSQDTHFQSFQRHFYTLGMHVCKLANGENARAIALALLTAFTQRIEWIIRQSSKVNLKPDKMDELEKRIFIKGQTTEKQMDNWFRCVQGHGVKRKRT